MLTQFSYKKDLEIQIGRIKCIKIYFYSVAMSDIDDYLILMILLETIYFLECIETIQLDFRINAFVVRLEKKKNYGNEP